MTTETIFTRQKQQNLALLALFCFSLVALRIIATHRIFYGFMIFNLLLAAVPYLIALLLQPPKLQHKYGLMAGTAAWLLFLPNAPYIVTDFLHFKRESAMPEWFDLLMLASFTLCGFAFGLSSLAIVQQIWRNRFGKRIAASLVFAGCMLSGFGIYIGRFLRYNSWDVIHKPAALLCDLPPLLLQPRAIAFSIGYGMLFFLVYRIFRSNADLQST